VLIFLLNALSAFFTPSFKASIPQMIREKKDFAPAITLSNITYQLLAIMGPGIAGIAAAWIGSRNIFLLDSLSFLLSALFVLAISRQLFSISPDSVKPLVAPTRMSELLMGTRLLFKDSAIRFALFTEFAAAIVGANILVNTIMYVKTKLSLDDKHYGLVMSALGVGAIVGAFASATLDKTNSRKPSLILGGVIISASVFFADQSSFIILMLIWLFAGLGQNLAEMPSQMLIAERIPLNQQGRVYGAHFAWSHLWWAIAYPIAGYLGTHYPNSVFLIAGSLGVLIMITSIILNSLKKPRL
jgi:NRE family putative nickel resistance protein-like MFS transporter